MNLDSFYFYKADTLYVNISILFSHSPPHWHIITADDLVLILQSLPKIKDDIMNSSFLQLVSSSC